MNKGSDLDSEKGGDYVLFCHTRDPQFELRIGKLLPPTAVVIDLALRCSVLDSFKAYNGQSNSPLDERVVRSIGSLLSPG